MVLEKVLDEISPTLCHRKVQWPSSQPVTVALSSCCYLHLPVFEKNGFASQWWIIVHGFFGSMGKKSTFDLPGLF